MAVMVVEEVARREGDGVGAGAAEGATREEKDTATWWWDSVCGQLRHMPQ